MHILAPFCLVQAWLFPWFHELFLEGVLHLARNPGDNILRYAFRWDHQCDVIAFSHCCLICNLACLHGQNHPKHERLDCFIRVGSIYCRMLDVYVKGWNRCCHHKDSSVPSLFSLFFRHV